MVTWKIDRMYVEQTPEHPNVVIRVDWSCRGAPGCPSVFNTARFEKAGDPFVDYDKLTQDEVLGWVWPTINKNWVEQQASTPLPPLPSDKTPQPLPWLQSAL